MAYTMLENERKKSEFIDTLLDSAVRLNENRQAKFHFFVDGKELPAACLCHLYGFSRTKLNARANIMIDKNQQYEFDESYKVTQRRKPHGNVGNNFKKQGQINVRNMLETWLDEVLTGLVDTAPDNDKKYMPCYLKPQDLLNDCRTYLLDFGIHAYQLPSLFLMRDVISTTHPNLRFPKNTKLGVCDTCTDLRTRKLLARSDAARAAVKKLMREHTQMHRGDRKIFWQRREASAMCPSIQWSTLSDSTSRMAISYIPPLPKGWGSIRRFPLTVFGLINFATRYRSLVPMPPIWKQDPNLTISLMYQHYYSMFSKQDVVRAPVLNETTDGSSKEYKNTANMAFACFKVLSGWFDEVNLFFLPPGHSHDLQDQAWANLKKAFYSHRHITYPDFVSLCKRAFSTFRPEVIEKYFVFDWKTWLHPWMRQLKNHSHWRAFEFRRSSSNPQAVLMRWKASKGSSEAFHGSEEYPDGVEILLEIPEGRPARILPTRVNLAEMPKIHKTFSIMTQEQRAWWEELQETVEVPNQEVPEVPSDYFDFAKFSYASWLVAHPSLHQEPVVPRVVQPDVEVDDTVGVPAHGNRILELYVGDCVSVRNEENGVPGFWLAKVRNIVDPPDGQEDNNVPWYQVWYYEQENAADDPWKHTTGWKLCNIRKQNSNALAVLSLDHFITAKFKMTKRNRIRKPTLNLIRRVIQLDAQENDNSHDRGINLESSEEDEPDEELHQTSRKRKRINKKAAAKSSSKSKTQQKNKTKGRKGKHQAASPSSVEDSAEENNSSADDSMIESGDFFYFILL